MRRSLLTLTAVAIALAGAAVVAAPSDADAQTRRVVRSRTTVVITPRYLTAGTQVSPGETRAVVRLDQSGSDGNLGRRIGTQVGAGIRGRFRRGVVRRHLPRIHFHHRVQLPAEAGDRVDASLVANEPGDVAVIPAHQKRAFAGLGNNTVPGTAALVAGVSDPLKRDGLGRADGQHGRGRNSDVSAYRLDLSGPS